MPGWTRFIIRHRWKVLALWLVLFLVGGFAASHVGDLLTNRFSVPGSDAERGLDLLQDRFDERGDGAFTLVVKTGRPVTQRVVRRVAHAASRAAAVVPNARPGPVRVAAADVVSVPIALRMSSV